MNDDDYDMRDDGSNDDDDFDDEDSEDDDTVDDNINGSDCYGYEDS